MINSWIFKWACIVAVIMKLSFVRQWVLSVPFHQVNLYKLCLNPIAVKYKLGSYIGDFKNCFHEGLSTSFQMRLLDYVDFTAWFLSLSTINVWAPQFCFRGLFSVCQLVQQGSWSLPLATGSSDSQEPTYPQLFDKYKCLQTLRNVPQGAKSSPH